MWWFTTLSKEIINAQVHGVIHWFLIEKLCLHKALSIIFADPYVHEDCFHNVFVWVQVCKQKCAFLHYRIIQKYRQYGSGLDWSRGTRLMLIPLAVSLVLTSSLKHKLSLNSLRVKYDSGHTSLGCVDASVSFIQLSSLQVLFTHPIVLCIKLVWKRERGRGNLCGNLIYSNLLAGYSGVLERAALNRWTGWHSVECVPACVHVSVWTHGTQLYKNNLPLCVCVWVYERAHFCVRLHVQYAFVTGESFSAIWALLSVSVKDPHYFLICSSLILYKGTHIDDYLVHAVINELSEQLVF